MIAIGTLFVFGILAVQTNSYNTCNRVIRSPDKMEVEIPHLSLERGSEEYQEGMNEEAAYWQGQGDKLGDKGTAGREQLEREREKNQENYEHEKEHQTEQQQNYNKEINETYHEDRDKAEAQLEPNQEHYSQYHNDSNYNHEGNPITEDLTEIGDKYEEKGTEYKNEGEDKVQNYNVSGNSPSFSYTRT